MSVAFGLNARMLELLKAKRTGIFGFLPWRARAPSRSWRRR
jgi:hypothetical protein